jgi:hypothetical protein
MAERKFTDLELERALAGEIDLAHRATDADRSRLEELRTEHAAFLSSVDVDAEVKAIQRRAGKVELAPRKFNWMRWMVSGGALAAAAAMILVVMNRKTEPKVPDDDYQTKGDVSLILHVANGAESKRLADGDTVTPGARIRFEVDTGKPGYVAVVGIDGAGKTSVYYPFGGEKPAPIDPRVDRLLPGAIELDATPGDEKFYVLYSEKSFEVPAQFPGLRGEVRLSAAVKTAEIVLHKK